MQLLKLRLKIVLRSFMKKFRTIQFICDKKMIIKVSFDYKHDIFFDLNCTAH